MTACAKANTYNIQSTASTAATTINAKAGADVLNVGNPNVLTGIAGNLTLTGSGSTLNMLDSGTSANETYTFPTATSFMGSDFAGTITYGVKAVNLTLGNGNDTVNVAGGRPTPTTTVTGGTGSNTLTGPNATNTWTITGSNKGTLGTKLTFAKFGSLVGGTGADDFKMSSTSASLSGSINGGGGADKLDYTLDHQAITVTLTSLSAGSTTSIAGGFSNIETVAGATADAASSTLVGPASDSLWTISAANGGKLSAPTARQRRLSPGPELAT